MQTRNPQDVFKPLFVVYKHTQILKKLCHMVFFYAFSYNSSFLGLTNTDYSLMSSVIVSIGMGYTSIGSFMSQASDWGLDPEWDTIAYGSSSR